MFGFSFSSGKTRGMNLLGKGGSSSVFDFGGGKVYKKTKNPHHYPSLQKAGIMPKVYKKGKDFLIEEKVKTYETANFRERKTIRSVVGDFQREAKYIKKTNSFWNRNHPKVNKKRVRPVLEKWGWSALLKFDLSNFFWGDVQKRNVGIKNGKPVLLDEGTIKYRIK